MTNPRHHIDIRKRIHQKHEAFPSNKLTVKFIDSWISLLGVLLIGSILPQAVQIWNNKDAANISIITWGFFTIWCLSMLTYGIIHRAKPIILTNVLSLPIYIFILIGIIIY